MSVPLTEIVVLATLDVAALLGGIGLVALAERARAPAGGEISGRVRAYERAGGALLVGALVGLGLLLARAEP